MMEEMGINMMFLRGRNKKLFKCCEEIQPPYPLEKLIQIATQWEKAIQILFFFARFSHSGAVRLVNNLFQGLITLTISGLYCVHLI